MRHSFCYGHSIQYIERASSGVVYHFNCKAQLSTSQLQAISLMSCIIAHSSEALYFFPRVIIHNFFLFLLIYGGLGFEVLGLGSYFWVFGVGAFS